MRKTAIWLPVRAVASAARETATPAVKVSGSNSASIYSWARKRAFRRARHRAAANGGTWHRGGWRSAHSLGVEVAGPLPHKPKPAHTSPTMQGRRPRVKVLSYNVGGMSAELYDVFLLWLREQECADVVLLQEIHWGMGRGEAQWTKEGWHFVVSASAESRYAGVCICISAKLAKASDIDFNVWRPGRLLHVRIHGRTIPVDVINAYQWARKPTQVTIVFGCAHNSGRSWIDCLAHCHAAMC